MSPHSSRGSSSREAAPRLSTAHTAASPTARFRKPARPLAARYSDPAPRSLRAVEESDFAPRIGERILFTGASGLLGRESVLELLRVGYDVRVLQRCYPIRFAPALSRCAATSRAKRSSTRP